MIEKIIPVNTRVRMITYSNNQNQVSIDGSHQYEGGLKRKSWQIRRLWDSRGGFNVGYPILGLFRYHLSAQEFGPKRTIWQLWGNRLGR